MGPDGAADPALVAVDEDADVDTQGQGPVGTGAAGGRRVASGRHDRRDGDARRRDKPTPLGERREGGGAGGRLSPAAGERAGRRLQPRAGHRDRGRDALDLAGELHRPGPAHDVVGRHQHGAGGQPAEGAGEARRPGVDPDPPRLGQPREAAQRLGHHRRVPGHAEQALERDLGWDAGVPGRQQVGRAGRGHQHARGAERPGAGRPEGAGAGGVGDVVAAAEHEHVEPGIGHGADHPCPAGRSQRGIVVAGRQRGRRRRRHDAHPPNGAYACPPPRWHQPESVTATISSDR